MVDVVDDGPEKSSTGFASSLSRAATVKLIGCPMSPLR